ncbi:hypothetical protein [Mangrovihabitans endophyticus]|uniref:Neocarzinostatin family protein n=1 Tax=Mangrovihabitans endophyticus TaxID=1751298 RepID=A0A8J3C3I2_9ACTN|nr:hypothetical protein [Mangrovihabitans endophyticus]GGL04823.1 hypothetical protein GCM10012284_44230 [Mangrovihabitans endophyticus]
MRRGKWTVPAVAAAAVSVGAALAFAVPASAGVNLQSESDATAAVKLGANARLDAKGAVVFAPVYLTCTPGSDSYLQVSVTQAVGNDIASGSRYREIDDCTGERQKIQVSVTPTNHPFQRGVAFGEAMLTVCDYRGCTSPYDEHTIRIR